MGTFNTKHLHYLVVKSSSPRIRLPRSTLATEDELESYSYPWNSI